jgi:hypothetical protein
MLKGIGRIYLIFPQMYMIAEVFPNLKGLSLGYVRGYYLSPLKTPKHLEMLG